MMVSYIIIQNPCYLWFFHNLVSKDYLSDKNAIRLTNHHIIYSMVVLGFKILLLPLISLHLSVLKLFVAQLLAIITYDLTDVETKCWVIMSLWSVFIICQLTLGKFIEQLDNILSKFFVSKCLMAITLYDFIRVIK